MKVPGVRKYVEFYQFEPRKVGKFHSSFKIPSSAILVGQATRVLYRSDKLNPTTGVDEGVIDYFHDHKDGVKVYRVDRDAEGPERRVPTFITGHKGLWRIGYCLGFSYTDHAGKAIKAEASDPLPELYALPSGKQALLVVQGKRRVLALIWGGNLRIEARGIVN
ncbi:MAG: hypothetical protein KJO40_13540 [Deltaproteobacteria bacterium]|nr:hypothetical protein [Deltaproteobacteria bacterium]